MRQSFKAFCSASFLSFFLFTVAGCGKSDSGVSGAYVGPAMSVEFKSGQKATVTVLNSPVDATYTIDGSKITVTPAGGATPPLTFTVNSDGSLTGADGSTLKKQ